MKKLQTLLLATLLVVPACSGGNERKEEKKTVAKHANVYQTVERDESSIQTLASYKTGEIDYRVIEGEDLVPYFTVEQYLHLFTPLFVEGANYRLVEENNKTNLAVTLAGSPIFSMTFDYKAENVLYSGSMSSVFPSSSSIDPAALYEGMKLGADVVNKKEVNNIIEFNYEGFDMDPIKVEDKYYLPLALIDNFVSKCSGHAIYNAYNEFYIVGGSDLTALTNTKFYETSESETPVTPLDRAKKNALEYVSDTFIRNEKTYPVMPLYLRKYHRNILALFFESQYGLKYVRGIHSMKEFFSGTIYWDELLEENALIRGSAFSHIIGDLADGHTSTRTYNDYVWGEASGRYLPPLWQERVKLKNDLEEARKEAYKKYDYEHAGSDEERDEIAKDDYIPDTFKVRYSDDDSMAFFNFDGFEINLDKEDPERYKKDTYTYFVRAFQSLKEDVKSVVIDMSTNGGGILVALMKILALISKDNKARLCLYQQTTNAQQLFNFSVDTNGDGKYDQDDVYGDDYNIYLLTSPYSFSCGNAYPFLAQRQGFAKIIGARSGGGECTVDTALLASGQFIGHSAMLRIGDLSPVVNEGIIDHYDFCGAEGGAPVDQGYAVNYFNYFNFNYLADLVKQ